jgi:hypothetical protein
MAPCLEPASHLILWVVIIKEIVYLRILLNFTVALGCLTGYLCLMGLRASMYVVHPWIREHPALATQASLFLPRHPHSPPTKPSERRYRDHPTTLYPHGRSHHHCQARFPLQAFPSEQQLPPRWRLRHLQIASEIRQTRHMGSLSGVMMQIPRTTTLQLHMMLFRGLVLLHRSRLASPAIPVPTILMSEALPSTSRPLVSILGCGANHGV